VNTSALLTDDPGDVVLSSLQLIDDCNRSAIGLHQRVTVVDPWQDGAAPFQYNQMFTHVSQARECGSCTPWRQLRRGCQSAYGLCV